MWKILSIASILPALLPCYIVSSYSSPFAGDESHTATIRGATAQSATKDVAITSVTKDGAPFANQGDTVTIQIGVANNGSSEETFTVSLRDETDDVEISSQEVTLASGATIPLSVNWDTTGATGDADKMAPPDPGSVHTLTATAILPGDTDSSNNSMSLQPGIWILGAPEPEPTGITFPEPQASPKADYGDGLQLNAPAVETGAQPITERYLSAVEAEKEGSAGSPSISTGAEGLTSVFTGGVAASDGAALAVPNVDTIAVPIPRITSEEHQARVETRLARPAITTEANPATQIFLFEQEVSSVSKVTEPGIATEATPLYKPFSTPVDAGLERAATRPLLLTEGSGGNSIYLDFVPAKVGDGLTGPNIVTRKEPLTSIYMSTQNARLLAEMTESGPGTLGVPLSRIFHSPGPATFSGSSKEPDLPDNSGLPIVLLETGTVMGRVRLEGQPHSLGAYVEIGDLVVLADRDGRFSAQPPPGTYTLYIRAPGHLTVVVPGVVVEPGQPGPIPTVMLAFGDADGDGVIDLYDLFLVARNFGAGSRTISPR